MEPCRSERCLQRKDRPRVLFWREEQPGGWLGIGERPGERAERSRQLPLLERFRHQFMEELSRQHRAGVSSGTGQRQHYHDKRPLLGEPCSCTL